MKKVSAIIVAAGKGRRFGVPKQFVLLCGKPVLDWCLETIEAEEKISEIVLVVNKDVPKEKYFRRYGKISSVVNGGERRQDSVISGFKKLDSKKTDIVLVHDGVRPLVQAALIEQIISVTEQKGAAIPLIPVEDTIKKVEGQEVLFTLERNSLFRVQTPQGFFYDILKAGLNKAMKENYYCTDEASLVERAGYKIYAVPGDYKNIKITNPDDIKIAEAFLGD